VFFRAVGDEIARYLPKGYDPKRLAYPYMFTFTTPPAWRDALAKHIESAPDHPRRQLWLRFRTLRNWLMAAELVGVLAFVAWFAFGVK
jgi:hypothetical protein